MLRNYFAAAIRNLFRNRAYAGINLLGLALGFATAILIGLFVRDEYSFDRFFPDHERIYRITVAVHPPSGTPLRLSVTAANIAPALELDFPEVESATRLAASTALLRQGDIDVSQTVHWADPNFFHLFPMKTLSGDLSQALNKPDGLVLTRSTARRLFGRDDVVGKALEVNREHSMRIAAVIEDLPSNTHFNASVFGAGVATFSTLSVLDTAAKEPGAMSPDSVYTYVRLRPGTRVTDLASKMPGFSERHVHGEINGLSRAKMFTFNLVPMADIHLQPRSLGDEKPPADPRTLHTMIAVALLILFVAVSNFVSMMTARATRRAVEVGVRKAVGATRRQIIVQFLGECLFYATLALVIAIMAIQLAMPAFNGFLQRGIIFDLPGDPILTATILAIALVTGLAAGAYPALVLSLFRPSTALKGGASLLGGSGRLRQALVLFQFATLIALIVATITIQRQTEFALEDRLRVSSEEIYFAWTGCPTAFKNSVANVPGVLIASCANGAALEMGRLGTVFTSTDGRAVSFRATPVDYDFLELFGIAPVAGRPFAPDRGQDDVLRANPASTSNPSIILNESGARALGYTDPMTAVGQHGRWSRTILTSGGFKTLEAQSSQIIAVVPDFSLGSVRNVIEPTAYYIGARSNLDLTIFKLDGQHIPETMRAIRASWAQEAGAELLKGTFLSQHINNLYADIRKQSAIFTAFSAVAVFVATLGLLGLAVFTAERRTREIGLRKVMGASRADILRFLAWQFARPVLWANVVAWPIAYFFMRRWLDGFAYHTDLNPFVFVVSSALALLVAVATVSGHALLVAGAKPAAALRYE